MKNEPGLREFTIASPMLCVTARVGKARLDGTPCVEIRSRATEDACECTVIALTMEAAGHLHLRLKEILTGDGTHDEEDKA